MRLAIIGSSIGQRFLPQKAKELGVETLCFSCEEGAITKEDVDYFYHISVSDFDNILRICKDMNIDGIVSNASNFCADTVNYVGEKLGLHTNPFALGQKIKDKFYVRQVTNNIPSLTPVRIEYFNGNPPAKYPCVIKPVVGGGKKGVSFANNIEEFQKSVDYAKSSSNERIIIEEFASGKEMSIETLSYEGKHYVIQITDKEVSGPPHFVEIGHHQPAAISEDVKKKIENVVPKILSNIGFQNGAAHIEMKRAENEDLYLIEVNPRGGGDEISNQLVYLSTGFDYVKAMIEVALGMYKHQPITSVNHSGILYLCEQTRHRAPFILGDEEPVWLFERVINKTDITESIGNWDRAAYIVYRNDSRVTDINF